MKSKKKRQPKTARGSLKEQPIPDRYSQTVRVGSIQKEVMTDMIQRELRDVHR